MTNSLFLWSCVLTLFKMFPIMFNREICSFKQGKREFYFVTCCKRQSKIKEGSQQTGQEET